ncbi:heavy-metal-associated domain-containing protein [Gluconacetobacter sacchari]|uniref:Heavy-metal-associated domain-containing protein n=2 Tax=Gluconacetobacter sacchari TaxID=92759 RepID=A0A7W4IGT9_9PROT|nr:heavy-metal-associated domain-containing protein [Gluconacetobacter sacchari]MBB2162593.1 heavy-metal-associated domain-containing protein [Gluconacetobacter sacchari]GBQ22764.1 cation/copper resistance transporter ATPase CopZ [Gluconacetobacter sacchari DSM 12717]
METLTLNVTGMTCDGCVSSVRKALENTDGVTAADVTLQPGRASISYDPARTSPAALRMAVEDAGFEIAA